jgi:hypothetical protein
MEYGLSPPGGEEELTPAALKELRVGILVGWLRIMSLTAL